MLTKCLNNSLPVQGFFKESHSLLCSTFTTTETEHHLSFVIRRDNYHFFFFNKSWLKTPVFWDLEWMPSSKLGSRHRIHSTSHENKNLPIQVSDYLHNRSRYDLYMTPLFSLLWCSPSLVIHLCFMFFCFSVVQ